MVLICLPARMEGFERKCSFFECRDNGVLGFEGRFGILGALISCSFGSSDSLDSQGSSVQSILCT